MRIWHTFQLARISSADAMGIRLVRVINFIAVLDGCSILSVAQLIDGDFGCSVFSLIGASVGVEGILLTLQVCVKDVCSQRRCYINLVVKH